MIELWAQPDLLLNSASREGNQRSPDYDLLMMVSTDIHRFVSVCTSSFYCRIIIKDFRDLYRFGENPGTRTGTKNNYVCRDVYSESMRYNSRFK